MARVEDEQDNYNYFTVTPSTIYLGENVEVAYHYKYAYSTFGFYDNNTMVYTSDDDMPESPFTYTPNTVGTHVLSMTGLGTVTITVKKPSMAKTVYDFASLLCSLLEEHYIYTNENVGLTTLVDYVKRVGQTVYPIITTDKQVETDKGNPLIQEDDIAISINNLGKKLAENLTRKMVYSVNTEGLTTLANKIPSIPSSNIRNFSKFRDITMTGTINYNEGTLPIQYTQGYWTGTFVTSMMNNGYGLVFSNGEVYTNTEFTTNTSYTLRFTFSNNSKIGFYYGIPTTGEKTNGYGIFVNTGTLYVEDYANGTSWNTGLDILEETNSVEIHRTPSSVKFTINGHELTLSDHTTTSFDVSNNPPNTIGFIEWADKYCRATGFGLDSETVWGYDGTTASGIILNPIDNTRLWTINLEFCQNRWDSHFGLYLGTEEEGVDYNGYRRLIFKSASDGNKLSFYDEEQNLAVAVTNITYTPNTWNTIQFSKMDETRLTTRVNDGALVKVTWNELTDYPCLHIGGSIWGNSNGANNPSGIRLRNITVTYNDE